MARTQRAKKGVRALILIAFEKGTVAKLRRRPGIRWAHRVKAVMRTSRERAPRPAFTGVARIHAANRAALKTAIDDIHENFSHVEAYEF